MVQRRADDLAAARHVHDLFAAIDKATITANHSGRSTVSVPRRRRRSPSPARRRVLRRIDPAAPNAAHATVHVLRGVRGLWAPCAFAGRLPTWRWRLACQQCVNHTSRLAAWAAMLSMRGRVHAACGARCPVSVVDGRPEISAALASAWRRWRAWLGLPPHGGGGAPALPEPPPALVLLPAWRGHGVEAAWTRNAVVHPVRPHDTWGAGRRCAWPAPRFSNREPWPLLSPAGSMSLCAAGPNGSTRALQQLAGGPFM